MGRANCAIATSSPLTRSLVINAWPAPLLKAIYGTASSGGQYDNGVIFEIAP
jgi:hypothetical protein